MQQMMQRRALEKEQAIERKREERRLEHERKVIEAHRVYQERIRQEAIKQEKLKEAQYKYEQRYDHRREKELGQHSSRTSFSEFYHLEELETE